MCNSIIHNKMQIEWIGIGKKESGLYSQIRESLEKHIKSR